MKGAGPESDRALRQNPQEEKEVKIQIIVTAAITTLATMSALILGCGSESEAPANRSNQSIQPASYPFEIAATEDTLCNAQRAAHLVIGNQITQSLATGADLAASLQQIDAARQALKQIDEAALAAQMVIGNQIMQGLADGSDLSAALQVLEQERQIILNGISLVQ